MKNSLDDSNPLVSIIALCYNQEHYCIETLDSLYNQTYNNYEVILLDDCSSDESVEVIKQWKIEHNGFDVKFIERMENVGICKSLNEGLLIAKGKYISVIACDDIMMPNKIEKQVVLLENSELDVGFVYSDAFIINKAGKQIHPSWLLSRFISKPLYGMVFKQVLSSKFILLQTTLIKREVFDQIGLFDESLSYEDYDMLLRLTKRYKVLYSNYVSCKYRKISSGTSSVYFSKHGKSTIQILLKHINAIDRDIYSRVKKKIRFTLLGVLCEDFFLGKSLLKEIKSKGISFSSLQVFSKSKFFLKIANIPFRYRHKLYSLRYLSFKIQSMFKI